MEIFALPLKLVVSLLLTGIWAITGTFLTLTRVLIVDHSKHSKHSKYSKRSQ